MGEWRYEILHKRWRAKKVEGANGDTLSSLFAIDTRSGDMVFAVIDLDWDEGHSDVIAKHIVDLHNAQVECWKCDRPGCDPKKCDYPDA